MEIKGKYDQTRIINDTLGQIKVHYSSKCKLVMLNMDTHGIFGPRKGR